MNPFYNNKKFQFHSFFLPTFFILFFSNNNYAQINFLDWHILESNTAKQRTATTFRDLPESSLKATISIEQFKRKLRNNTQEIVLPTPNGEAEVFIIKPSQTVAQEVAHLYTIKTFSGYKKSDPTVLIACDISDLGFHAGIYAGAKSYFIEPSSTKEVELETHYIYFKHQMEGKKTKCGFSNDYVHNKNLNSVQKRNTPNQKTTYRLGIIAAGEFSQQFGGSPYNVSNVLNALASGVNMLNPIYLRDLGITFTLVSNANMVYSDPSTDPIDTNDQDAIVAGSHTLCVMALGQDGFDVGHTVVWEDLGGLASFQVICNGDTKGEGFSGATGSATTLWVDYVAHEIGHQFGSEHNFASSECGTSENGFRYEPGEGSSIMAYANVCGEEVQYSPSSDPYFHYASIKQIQDFAATISCGTTDNTGNANAPIPNANADITIPKQTPFILVGTATDANDAMGQLSYGWQQYDGNGNATTGSPDCNATNSPLFRYRPPIADNFRVFPQNSDVLAGNNNAIQWEKLPCTARTMNFSLAVRDNNTSFGRVAHDQMAVTVANTGPFEVSSPNGGESLTGNAASNITWAVNGTDSHCSNVDILLSTDGGNTFTVIANATANDGSESVTIPNNASTTARILIRCDVAGDFRAASTFFDVSNANFTVTAGNSAVDNDMDGFNSDVDCDDNDASVNPNASEICNGKDDDCDGLIDGADSSVSGTDTWYKDNDNDGFGTSTDSTMACSQPTGYVSNKSDCDDGNAAVNPNASETCNGVDDDCDGLIDAADSSVSGTGTWYKDNDTDGFGTSTDSTMACSQPTGYVNNKSDCDDGNAAINPNASETCNGVDDDCDGLIDGADSSVSGTGTWYKDNDNDGFGTSTDSTMACSQPTGYVSNKSDCDDGNAAVNPNASETCNGVDDDCDGLIDGADNSVSGTGTWYKDNDNDGFGTSTDSTMACSQPTGYVNNKSDCDDGNAAINPNASETCNGVDDDCDGLIDGADNSVSGTGTWYKDNDNDGFGTSTDSTMACSQPTGYVNNKSDCDDGNAAINPNASETCNGIDDDCDGLIDEADNSVSGTGTWYKDNDNDGFGTSTDSTMACSQPTGYVNNKSDCDDGNAAINPNGIEIANNQIDENCDGMDDIIITPSCEPPTDIQLEVLSANKVIIEWGANAAAKRYNIQIRFKGQDRWLITANIPRNKVFVYAPANKEYEFRIQAVCTEVNSDYSEIFEFSTNSNLLDEKSESRNGDDFIANITIQEIPSESINLYPNPVKSIINIDFQSATESKWTIYHSSGQLIRSQLYYSVQSIQKIDIFDLKTGLYFLKIEEKGKSPISKRFLKIE